MYYNKALHIAHVHIANLCCHFIIRCRKMYCNNTLHFVMTLHWLVSL